MRISFPGLQVTRRRYETFIIGISVANMLDAISTVNALLFFDVVEHNPLFGFLNGGGGYLWFILIKLFISLWLLLGARLGRADWYWLSSFSQRVSYFVIVIVFSFLSMVVASNFFVAVF